MLFDVGGFLDGFSGQAVADPENPFAGIRRRAWHEVERPEPRCDFAPDRFRLNSRGVMFVSLWKRSIYGMTLPSIKAHPDMPRRFADGLAPFIGKILGSSLASGSWAIITPPPRRHKLKNFAQNCAGLIAARLGIPFHPDVSECHSRMRVNAEFTLLNLPPEANLIVFDDICTTGSTLMSMNRLLQPLGKNLFFIVGINNKE